MNHATMQDAQTFPRQIGRNIAEALLDGRPAVARMYWETTDDAGQAIAAAEVALALAERGIAPPSPSEIALIIIEERASLELYLPDGSVWRRTPSGWYLVCFPAEVDSPALRAELYARLPNAAVNWAA